MPNNHASWRPLFGTRSKRLMDIRDSLVSLNAWVVPAEPSPPEADQAMAWVHRREPGFLLLPE